jgi:exonuclease SbcD
VVRILHFADLHVGVENYSRPATDKDVDELPDTFAPDVTDRLQTYVGLPTRLLDSLRAFDELVATAINDGVDLVLFCGDAYRTRDPSQTHQREFARRIARLTNHGIQVFLLTGNHDLPNAFGRATSLEIFDTLSIPNVTVAPRLDSHRIATTGGPVQVIAVPWMRRSFLVAQEDTKNLSFEEQNEEMQGFLSTSVGGLIEEMDPEVPTLVAVHGMVATATVGSERTMLLGTDYVMLPSMFQDRRVDYVALGHVHKYQRLSESPPTVYSGSVHRVDFSEEKDEKGFVVIDIDPGIAGSRAVRSAFKPIWSRRFVTIEATIQDDDPEPTETVLTAVNRHEVTDAVVRVEVALPEGVTLDLRRVRETLAEAHSVTGISLNVQRAHRTRLGNTVTVEALSPLEMLDRYMEERKIPLDRQQVLRRYAAPLIGEESIGDQPAQTLPLDDADDADESLEQWHTHIASPNELEGAFEIRRRVFIDEQGVDPEIEWDGQDETAVHAIATIDGRTVGTGRFLKTDDPEVVRIGRMAVVSEHRRRGIGETLLRILEEHASSRGALRATLHAQTYVRSFYASHGYVAEGETFDEAGIEHIAMQKDISEPRSERGQNGEEGPIVGNREDERGLF